MVLHLSDISEKNKKRSENMMLKVGRWYTLTTIIGTYEGNSKSRNGRRGTLIE